MAEHKAQNLIDLFFEELKLKQLQQCQALLLSLDNIAAQEVKYRSWHTFLSGILTNELHQDWAKGEQIFNSLLQLELDPYLRGRVLNALGVTYRRQGRWTEAITVYKKTLDIFNKLEQTLERITAWRNLAIVLEIGYSQGVFSTDALYEGIDYCQLALESLLVLDDSDNDTLWQEATTWNTLGMIFRSLNNWSQSIRCYERFLALAHALDDLHSIGMASNNMGEILQLQGPEKWPEAKAAYLEALVAYRQFDDTYEQIDVLANLGSLHKAMGELETALDYYAEAITLIESLREGVSAAEARTGFFATMTNTYAHAVHLCIELDHLDQAFHYMERARARSFLDLLRADSAHLAEAQNESILTLAQVQAELPPETLLLEYFTMGLIDPKARTNRGDTAYRHRQPPARVYLFAITAEAIEVVALSLSPNEILPQRLKQVVEKYFLTEDRLAFFGEALLTPVKDHIVDKKYTYIVPHGPLHYIPFQALLTNEASGVESPFLFSQPDLHIAYAPSATILLRHCRAKAGQRRTSILTVGYNGSGPTELDHPEAEALSVAQLFNGQTLSGPHPKKEALFNLAQGTTILHIACHGHFKPADPMTSYLELGPEEQLTAQEVVERLSLPTRSLVTMSACESGLSQVLRGDELMGLARAFIIAGASAVLCTMWRVEEVSTRLLMERLYHHLQQGLPLTEALKQAQHYLRHLTGAQVEALLTTPYPQNLRYPKPLVQPPISPAQDAHFELPSSDQETAAKIFNAPRYWAPFILIGGFDILSA